MELSEIQTLFEALDDRESSIAPEDEIKWSQVAVAGYSAGAATAIAAADLEIVDAFIALSGRGELTDTSRSKPALIFAEEDDTVIPAFVSELVFERLSGRAVFLEVAGGGHSALVDLCPHWAAVPGLMSSLTPWLGSVSALSNGCGAEYPQPEEVWKVVGHSSVAFLYDVFGIEVVGRALSEPALERLGEARLSVFETKP
jgi:hypothetical protein